MKTRVRPLRASYRASPCLVQETLAAGAERGEFNGNPAAAALHIIAVTRGLGVLERAFGDEPQLRKIAAHTIDLVLGKKGGQARPSDDPSGGDPWGRLEFYGGHEHCVSWRC